MKDCFYCRPGVRRRKSEMCAECKRIHDLHELAEVCPIAEQESQAWIRENAARLRSSHVESTQEQSCRSLRSELWDA